MFETFSPLSSMPGTAAKLADPDGTLVGAWVERADPAAFEELVRLHQVYVFRLALSVLGPGWEADAEDVVQETFMRAATRLQNFRGDSRFRTWLHRLALNLALDRRRRSRWRLPHVDIEVLERRPGAPAVDDPFTSAADGERARALHECVDRLPDSLRSVIHMRYWLDLTIEDIAATLGLPIGTVKSHLHRGRTLLCQAMKERGLGRAGRLTGTPSDANVAPAGTLDRPRLCGPCGPMCAVPDAGRVA
jgi:RNA polymerase sigma-70 factor (ECF subfamily)